MELRVFCFFPPLPAEYEAELPPFPEGYKVKQDTVVTVSITPGPNLTERFENSTDSWWASDSVMSREVGKRKALEPEPEVASPTSPA